MRHYDPSHIRNVAVVGHGGSGKTALVEALLLAAGAINRLGHTGDGTTTTDYEPEEHKREHSVSLGMAPIEWDGHKINLIDCPGSADFVGDTYAALRVADAALFVVSAVDGVEVQTELIWEKAQELGLPALFVINKIDRERASYERTLEQLTQVFGAKPFPLEIPVGQEHEFHGVIDLLALKDFEYDEEHTKGTPIDIETDVSEERGHVVEAAAEGDDELLEKYLESGDLDEKEVALGLGEAVAAGAVAPVLVASATHLIGIDRIAQAICALVPSPDIRGATKGTSGPDADDEVEREVSADAPPAVFVFKTISDPYVGKISLFRVFSGTVRPDAHLWNVTQDSDERIGQVFALRGKHHEPEAQIGAGDIGAVAKLAHTHTGDTLAEKTAPFYLPPVDFPEPVFSVAVEPKSKGDEDKLGTSLQRLIEEDPVLRMRRDAETHQTVVSGLGEAHVDVTLERLKRKYSVEVGQIPLRIPYRETIRGKADHLSRYVKQSGGRGQYAVAHLVVEAQPHGGGYEFINKIVGGAIPSNFIPSIDKGIHGAMLEGVYAGYPVVDVKVTVDDGKFHTVDSSDMAFQICGSMGFKEACRIAGLTLLEPIMDVHIRVPDALMGDIMGDINAKRGKIVGTEPDGRGRTEIHAQVPQAEMVRYAIDLRSITGGRGTFSMEHSYYEEVPQHLQPKLVEAHKAELAEHH